MTQDNLHDIQSQPDDRQIPIDRVGVRRLRYPIQVRDREHSTQFTIATVQLTVDLPHNHKGTHMSRFLEVLNSHGPILHIHHIREILESLRRKLHAESAHLEFEFPYFLEKSAPVTGARSLMDYTVRLQANLHGNKFDFILVVIVPVTTLCPCSKAISRYGAHNQRSIVTFAVRFRKP
ncbi:MAG: GTP cyclohydrolase, FolE2/MptA family, partial [Chthoniobacterales bacterium]|nr:GTP cyclohydrolase, FolE2/MptA family [Chthoniobacterales bacterium]